MPLPLGTEACGCIRGVGIPHNPHQRIFKPGNVVSTWLEPADIQKLDKVAKMHKWSRSKLVNEFVQHCLHRGVLISKKTNALDPATALP